MSYPYLTLDGITLYNRVTGQTPPDPDGVEWAVTDMSGWVGGPPPRTARAARVAGHGAYRSPAYRDPRIITIDATVTTPYNPGLMRQIEARITAICSDPGRLYPLTETDPVLGARSADVELDGEIKVAPRDGLGYSSVVSLQLAAPDPRIYGPEIIAATTLPDGGTGGLDMDPAGANMSDPGADLGQAGSSGVATLITAGTAPSGVVLEIVGPVPTPTVWCAELGVRLTWAGSVAAGQTLWINTGDFAYLGVPARATLLGGQSWDHLLTVTGGWPDISPGVSHWAISGGAYDAAARLRVHARSAFW